MVDPKKILIVDDEYAFGKSLKDYFERVGFEVAIATDGAAALDMISGMRPDLITLDVRMPGINGFDILEQLSEMESPPKVLVVSAIDSTDVREKLLQLGAIEVFHKPVNLTDLILKMKVLLA